MRLNTAIARATGWSRRAADKAIEEKRVRVNKAPARLGQQVDPERDRVSVDGRNVSLTPASTLTIAFYKPKNVVSTRSDPQRRKTIMDFLPQSYSGLKPAGRLDFESEGLLLLSTDGNFILHHTHPRYETEKEYEVKLQRPVSEKMLSSLRRGIRMAEGIARADRVEQVNAKTLRIVIHQGWNRQIRRMIGACENEVASLKRTRIGSVTLAHLRPGQWRQLTPQETSGS